jgi:hypothetical protein
MTNQKFKKDLKNELEVVKQLFRLGLITSKEYVLRIETTNAELRNLKSE